MNLTENGDVAYTTTGNYNLDLFTRITRNATKEDVIETWCKAWEENTSTALQILMHMRDPRKGKQEKFIPIQILSFLKSAIPEECFQLILKSILPYGCWKDVLKIYTMVPHGTIELKLMAEQLKIDIHALNESSTSAISLAAKWAPSEQSQYHDAFKILKKELKLSSKEYRLQLTRLRAHLNILEMFMATHQYDKIDFSKIPASALKKMSGAFKRDTNASGVYSDDRKQLNLSYNDFMRKVSQGKATIKVAGIQPHELIVNYMNGYPLDQLIEEQWKAITLKVLNKGAFNKVTAIVDVSGSMEGQPMQVAIALGIMVADCTTGPFKGQIITFHSSPSWHKLTGETLREKVLCLKRAPWGGNTNLRATFNLILNEAIRYQLSPDQMIDTLFVFTDMQFDAAFTDSSTFNDIKSSYHHAGYTMPKMIFWNLRTSSTKSLPVLKDENNVVLLSGFSAELLNCIMDAQEISPLAIMTHVLKPYPILNIDCPLL